MDDLMLVRPSRRWFSELLAYKKAFIEAGDSMDGAGPLRECDDMEEYLRISDSYLQKETLPPGYVVATNLLCIRKSDEKLVGMIQVRHYLNDYLSKFAGHIGYSVHPSERRKGYAAWMLHNVLPFCRSVGIDRALVTCNDYNEGSRRTILKNGGIFDGVSHEEETGETIERYWIDITKNETLETQNLRLRKARITDMEKIWHNVWEDETIAATMLWKPTKTLEEAQDRIAKTIDYQSKLATYFICLKDTDEPIGMAGIRKEAPGVYEECGIGIATAHQGKGYGKEVTKALIKLAFDVFDGREFVYAAFSDNYKSKRVAESLGFTYTHSMKEVRAWDGYEYVADYFSLKNPYAKEQ